MSIININTTCRVCINEHSKMLSLLDVKNAYNKTYSQLLVECVYLKIQENDGLPIVICETCANELSSSYEFLKKCQSSDRSLREYLNSSESQDIFCSNDHDKDSCDSELEQPPIYNISTQSRVRKEKRKYLQVKKEYKMKNLPKSTIQGESLKSIGYRDSASNATTAASQALPHSSENLHCLICDTHFTCSSSLKAHTKRFHSDTGKTVTCQDCGERFYRMKDMVVHMRRHTGETPFGCSFCKRRFSQQSTLIRHVRTHTGEKPFCCKICGKSFAGQSMLKVHYSVHSDEKKFTCNICGKSVKTKDSLVKHQRLHEDMKPNVCDQCGMAFATKGNLKLHMGNMHSENSGQCSICNKNCSNLKTHMNRHSEETPFQCNICSRFFAQKGNLSAHMLKHNNAEKFACSIDECCAKFYSQRMLDYHILKHHKHQMSHSCSHCGRGFFRSCDLSRHIKSNCAIFYK